nr:ribonuclease H-like domain-containing protein [Tanacetum cinerariifolium]
MESVENSIKSKSNQGLNSRVLVMKTWVLLKLMAKMKLGLSPHKKTQTIVITFDLPTVEPEDFLRIGDEHLDTIPKTESNEYIKSSVKNLVSSPSESEDLSDSECDVLACNDFTTFSNLLFDADNNFSSSDNESFFDEDISNEIYSNPLFDVEIISIKIDPHHFNAESELIESLLSHNSSIISSSLKIDYLLDEFAGELILLKTIPPGIDKTDCDPKEEIYLIEKLLYDNSLPRPPEEFISKNSNAAIESFSPSPILVEDSDSLMEEIDFSFTLDDSMSPGIKNDYYDSEGDILIREELLSNNSLSLHENESFHFNIPSFPRPPAKPPDGEIKPNSGILTIKVEKSPHLLSHRGRKAFQLSSKSPMNSWILKTCAKGFVLQSSAFSASIRNHIFKSNRTNVYLLAYHINGLRFTSKDETSDILKKFITEVENLKDYKVKIIRTPQQNGVTERRNRTLIEAARPMLADAKLPVTFWAEAVNTACYVQNRPVVAGTQSNGNAGTKDNNHAGQAIKEKEPGKDYILLPLWTADPSFS